ncbi:hypothetical protein CYY_008764 [Polysphondylium violaceum]|uniref:Uncharacterized protein n=1 Tax=Polysphondylium violaceum TaxID=133409 RepID=A0A8J4PL66_9MYCE|nr:hypothetical protein CYY_008764 [Polysphondylium violaceum]
MIANNIDDDEYNDDDDQQQENNAIIKNDVIDKNEKDTNLLIKDTSSGVKIGSDGNQKYDEVELLDGADVISVSHSNEKSKKYQYRFKNGLLNSLYGSFKSIPNSIWRVVHIGFGFALVFFGYTPTQNITTKIHPEDGATGLTLLYLFFAFGCFFAPTIVNKLGIIVSLSISSMLYAVFVFCSIEKLSFLFIPACCLAGLAAAILWTSQNVYISRSSPTPEKLGTYFGVFQVVFSVGGITGNAITGAFSSSGLSITITLIVLGIITVIGAVITSLVRLPKFTVPNSPIMSSSVNPNIAMAEPIQQQQPEQPILQVLLSVFMSFTDKKFLLIVPLLILQGHSQGYFYETIPSMMDLSYIGLVMIMFSLVSLAGAVWGKILDLLGKSFMVKILGLMYCVSLGLSLIAYYKRPVFLFYIMAALNGAFDTLQTILIFGLIGSIYSNTENVAKFSAARFCTSIGTSFSFFIFDYIPVPFIILIIFVLVIVYMISLCYLLDYYLPKQNSFQTLSTKDDILSTSRNLPKSGMNDIDIDYDDDNSMNKI